jgi:GMP synthase (glutamine-hydrolysing)
VKNIIIICCGPGLNEVNVTNGYASQWIQNACNLDNIKFLIKNAYLSDIPLYNEGDAWIIAGSSSSVYEDKEWIIELEIAIKRAYEIDKPLLGICFGHQLIAQALGGKVEKNARGWELGTYPINIVKKWKTHKIFSNVNENDVFYTSHKDVITQLPPMAVELANNKKGNQAFSVGNKIIGVQFHPEFTHSVMNKYIEVRQRMGATVDDLSIKRSKSSYKIIDNFINLI